jgi:hypothetical protein
MAYTVKHSLGKRGQVHSVEAWLQWAALTRIWQRATFTLSLFEPVNATASGGRNARTSTVTTRSLLSGASVVGATAQLGAGEAEDLPYAAKVRTRFAAQQPVVSTRHFEIRAACGTFPLQSVLSLDFPSLAGHWTFDLRTASAKPTLSWYPKRPKTDRHGGLFVWRFGKCERSAWLP